MIRRSLNYALLLLILVTSYALSETRNDRIVGSWTSSSGARVNVENRDTGFVIKAGPSTIWKASWVDDSNEDFTYTTGSGHKISGRYDASSDKISVSNPKTKWSASWYRRDPHLITGNSIGDLRIGMTVQQAKSAMPGFDFKKEMGAEVLWWAVSKDGVEHLRFFAGYEGDGKIENIEAFHKSYATREGIHPDMTVKEAAEKLGGLETIRKSEIESREYATFNKGPEGVSYRVRGKETYEAGIYYEGNGTKNFTPGAFIFIVSANGVR